jgi:hypothetical protein
MDAWANYLDGNTRGANVLTPSFGGAKVES